MICLRCLHVCDNTKIDGSDKLAKICPMLNILVAAWQAAYYPNQKISLDESMIAFNGRTGVMVYQLQKPRKWGMQAWFLADSRITYCYNLKIYSGKRADNVDSGVGVTHATVMRMVQPCIDRGHHIYFDNYYTSPAVLKDLSSKGFGACGTLRVNRKDVSLVIK